MYRSHVLVCGGTGCTSSNSQKIIQKLSEIRNLIARSCNVTVNVVGNAANDKQSQRQPHPYIGAATAQGHQYH